MAMMRRDQRAVYQAAYEANLTEWHLTAAWILLDVHGLKYALLYVQEVQARRQIVKSRQENAPQV